MLVLKVIESELLKENSDLTINENILGNKLTLETRPKENGLDVRDELLKFHNSLYSANIMALAVLGRGKSNHINFHM